MEKKYFDLTERVALITGCSSGLGVQMAKALASQGCNIVAVARRKNLIDEVAKEIAEKYKVKAIG
ncbi:MAG: SDR family NAD(P)-dependent oxidoreductase, partial [Butyrivibrio sp.]|nr:SDR family NAD(P)-dependent oxidoreductase [Butyrivibrio sp.]